MLTEICGYLKNWFNRRPDGSDYPKFHGDFVVKDGVIKWDSGENLPLQEGQYYRIIGGVFNNGGVFRFMLDSPLQETVAGSLPKDEEFNGEVWSMAVPPDVVAIAEEIAEWNEANGKADSAAMSPFNSESFGGYSYSKSGGSGSSSGGRTGVTWADVFGARLTRYKKL